MILLGGSCFYIWEIYHVPANLELRSWFSVDFGHTLIFLWQIVIIIGAIVLGKRFISKQIFPFRIFYYVILIFFSGSIFLYLTWNFMKISVINDKDIVNEVGKLTVYRDRDILEPNDYDYFLYEKEGILYRRYLREMIDEKDY